MAGTNPRPSMTFLGPLRAAVLLLGGMFTGMVQLAILPAMPLMAKHFAEFGDGDFIAQSITTIAAPAMAVGGPLAGWLAGRFGKRTVLLIAMLLYGLSGAGGAFAPDLWVLLGSRVVLGVAAAAYITIAVSLIGDYYEPGSRDKLIGIFTAVAGGSSFVTLFVAGKLTEMGGWHAPFALYIAAIPVLVVAFFTISEPSEKTGEADADQSQSVAAAWRFYAIIIASSISLYTVSIQGPFLMSSIGLVNPSVQSNVLLLATVGTMVGAYVFGFIRPKLGFNIVLGLTWMLVGFGNVGFALTANVYLLAACSGLVGLSSGLMQPLTQTAILNKVGQGASARAMGLAVGCIFFGQFLHPYVLSAIRVGVGLHDAFVWVGAVSLFAGIVAATWPKTHFRPEFVTADKRRRSF